MDAAGVRNPIRNQKGIAIIFIALAIVVICGFLGLAVDIGYMYVAKGQLQNAADAAALAGAAKLVSGGDAYQTAPRDEAKNFAARNKAAGEGVMVSVDGSNSLVATNDINLGNWNPRRYPTEPFSETRTPINAVKARARRTDSADPAGQSIGGRVSVFFSKIVDSAFAKMPASATAIASRPARAGFYFMIGQAVCNATTFPLLLSPEASNMAWTSLINPLTGLSDSSTSASEVKDEYICRDQVPNIEVCGESIYTSNGIANTIFQAVEVDFYDPDYDRINKTYRADGSVDTWTIIVPVSSASDPSVQPNPHPVWGYASIRVTRSCGTGTGNPCATSTGRLFTAPTGICGGGENGVFIDQVLCRSCDESVDILGPKASLVQ